MGQVAIDTTLRNGEGISRTSFRTVLTHELLHALGIGTTSSRSPYYDGTRQLFAGPVATREFAVAGGTGPVPMDVGGAHFANLTFNAVGDVLAQSTYMRVGELMAPQTGTTSTMSRISGGMLIDLRYDIDLTRVNGFTLPSLVLAQLRAGYGPPATFYGLPSLAAPQIRLHLGTDVLPPPM